MRTSPFPSLYFMAAESFSRLARIVVLALLSASFVVLYGSRELCTAGKDCCPGPIVRFLRCIYGSREHCTAGKDCCPLPYCPLPSLYVMVAESFARPARIVVLALLFASFVVRYGSRELCAAGKDCCPLPCCPLPSLCFIGAESFARPARIVARALLSDDQACNQGGNSSLPATFEDAQGSGRWLMAHNCFRSPHRPAYR